MRNELVCREPRGFAGAHQRPDLPGSQRSGGHQPDDEHGERNRDADGPAMLFGGAHPSAEARATPASLAMREHGNASP
jgi:hypothetical protein